MNTTKIKIVGLLWLTSAWISTTQAQDNFQIMLSGAYQAPPNHSAGSGGGNAVAMGTVLCYDIFVSGVNPTRAAIFGPAPAGSTGSFIADLTNAMSNP